MELTYFWRLRAGNLITVNKKEIKIEVREIFFGPGDEIEDAFVVDNTIDQFGVSMMIEKFVASGQGARIGSEANSGKTGGTGTQKRDGDR